MTGRGRRTACAARLAQLLDLVEGDLAGSKSARLRLHLRACACCAGIERDLRRSVASARALGRTRLPAPVRRRAKQRIRRLLDQG